MNGSTFFSVERIDISTVVDKLLSALIVSISEEVGRKIVC